VDPPNMPEGAYLLRARSQVRLHDLISAKVKDRDLIDFLSCCLCIDPAERASAEEALQHPWLVKNSMSVVDTTVERTNSFLEGILDGYNTNTDSNLSDGGYSSQGSHPSSPRGGSPQSETAPSSSRPFPKGSISGMRATPSGFTRRGKKSGPGIPANFREQLQAEPLASGAHDFRQRFVRTQAPPNATRCSFTGSGPSGSPNPGSTPPTGAAPQPQRTVAAGWGERASPASSSDLAMLGKPAPAPAEDEAVAPIAPHRPKKRL